MRASEVNAAIMRVIGKLEQNKMRTIGIVRIWEARITVFYCMTHVGKLWVARITVFYCVTHVGKLWVARITVFYCVTHVGKL